MFVSRHEILYSEDEYADEIYFIIKGRVNYVVGEELYDYKSLQRGAYFGDIEVVNKQPRRYKTQAAYDLDLLVM